MSDLTDILTPRPSRQRPVKTRLDDPKFQERLKKELRKWERKIEPKLEQLRKMERITAEDLAVRVR